MPLCMGDDMRNMLKKEIGEKIEEYIISKFGLNDAGYKNFYDAYDDKSIIYEIKSLMINSKVTTKRFTINKNAHDKLLKYMSFYIFVLYEYKNNTIIIKQIEKVDTKKVDMYVNGCKYGRVRPEVLFDLKLKLNDVIT